MPNSLPKNNNNHELKLLLIILTRTSRYHKSWISKWPLINVVYIGICGIAQKSLAKFAQNFSVKGLTKPTAQVDCRKLF